MNAVDFTPPLPSWLVDAIDARDVGYDTLFGGYWYSMAGQFMHDAGVAAALDGLLRDGTVRLVEGRGTCKVAVWTGETNGEIHG